MAQKDNRIQDMLTAYRSTPHRVVQKETQGDEQFLIGDAEEEEEAGIATPHQSLKTNLEASAEEAAAVAYTIALPDPDHDSAIESD